MYKFPPQFVSVIKAIGGFFASQVKTGDKQVQVVFGNMGPNCNSPKMAPMPAQLPNLSAQAIQDLQNVTLNSMIQSGLIGQDISQMKQGIQSALTQQAVMKILAETFIKGTIFLAYCDGGYTPGQTGNPVWADIVVINILTMSK
jgi:hypothetical protein